MEKNSIIIYNNGVVIRDRNSRLDIDMLKKGEDEVVLVTHAIACENPKIPCVLHNDFRNKVRVSSMKFSRAAFEDMLYAYIRYMDENKKAPVVAEANKPTMGDVPNQI